MKNLNCDFPPGDSKEVPCLGLECPWCNAHLTVDYDVVALYVDSIRSTYKHLEDIKKKYWALYDRPIQESEIGEISRSAKNFMRAKRALKRDEKRN